ncbi:uncharacterized protein JN550_012626 [Neoarthrinium moseri]|uniref:uncharacterized protein n=1 Tax=Neoarthrinium moseri TaxID=1658444 RepID=UPI001FDDF6C8|nr:uncharacterized protein JN550_012626 [Neoarthrinium moseri]KAI1858493.1 hypothetical protein JN550_012626 [Neoarthrinium moseri]
MPRHKSASKLPARPLVSNTIPISPPPSSQPLQTSSPRSSRGSPSPEPDFRPGSKFESRREQRRSLAHDKPDEGQSLDTGSDIGAPSSPPREEGGFRGSSSIVKPPDEIETIWILEILHENRNTLLDSPPRGQHPDKEFWTLCNEKVAAKIGHPVFSGWAALKSFVQKNYYRHRGPGMSHSFIQNNGSSRRQELTRCWLPYWEVRDWHIYAAKIEQSTISTFGRAFTLKVLREFCKIDDDDADLTPHIINPALWQTMQRYVAKELKKPFHRTGRQSLVHPEDIDAESEWGDLGDEESFDDNIMSEDPNPLPSIEQDQECHTRQTETSQDVHSAGQDQEADLKRLMEYECIIMQLGPGHYSSDGRSGPCDNPDHHNLHPPESHVGSSVPSNITNGMASTRGDRGGIRPAPQTKMTQLGTAAENINFDVEENECTPSAEIGNNVPTQSNAGKNEPNTDPFSPKPISPPRLLATIMGPPDSSPGKEASAPTCISKHSSSRTKESSPTGALAISSHNQSDSTERGVFTTAHLVPGDGATPNPPASQSTSREVHQSQQPERTNKQKTVHKVTLRTGGEGTPPALRQENIDHKLRRRKMRRTLFQTPQQLEAASVSCGSRLYSPVAETGSQPYRRAAQSASSIGEQPAVDEILPQGFYGKTYRRRVDHWNLSRPPSGRYTRFSDDLGEPLNSPQAIAETEAQSTPGTTGAPQQNRHPKYPDRGATALRQERSVSLGAGSPSTEHSSIRIDIRLLGDDSSSDESSLPPLEQIFEENRRTRQADLEQSLVEGEPQSRNVEPLLGPEASRWSAIAHHDEPNEAKMKASLPWTTSPRNSSHNVPDPPSGGTATAVDENDTSVDHNASAVWSPPVPQILDASKGLDTTPQGTAGSANGRWDAMSDKKRDKSHGRRERRNSRRKRRREEAAVASHRPEDSRLPSSESVAGPSDVANGHVAKHDCTSTAIELPGHAAASGADGPDYDSTPSRLSKVPDGLQQTPEYCGSKKKNLAENSTKRKAPLPGATLEMPCKTFKRHFDEADDHGAEDTTIKNPPKRRKPGDCGGDEPETPKHKSKGKGKQVFQEVTPTTSAATEPTTNMGGQCPSLRPTSPLTGGLQFTSPPVTEAILSNTRDQIQGTRSHDSRPHAGNPSGHNSPMPFRDTPQPSSSAHHQRSPSQYRHGRRRHRPISNSPNMPSRRHRHIARLDTPATSASPGLFVTPALRSHGDQSMTPRHQRSSSRVGSSLGFPERHRGLRKHDDPGRFNRSMTVDTDIVLATGSPTKTFMLNKVRRLTSQVEDLSRRLQEMNSSQ